MREWILKLANKLALKNYTKVDLSIGTVYLKPLNHGIINNCRSKSTITGTLLNDSLFFQLVEYELTKLSKKQIDNLSIEDGRKLRLAVKNMCISAGVARVEGEHHKRPDGLTAEDVQAFEDMKKESLEAMKTYRKELIERGEKPKW